MIKKMALPIILALFLFFSIGSIQASDVNITDSGTLASIEDMSLQIEDANVSQSVDSNALSNQLEENSLKDTVKNQTEITLKTKDIYYKGSCSVILKDSNISNAIANKKVNLIINNVNYVAKSDSNGVASVKLSLNPGKYNLVAYFEGDDAYLKSNTLKSTIQVLPTVKANDITKYYNGAAQYTAVFYDSYGKALANRNVVITVNGKSYVKKTNANGVAFLAINFKPGTYIVTSTDPITGYKLTTNFRILPTIASTDLKKVKRDNKKFIANFFKSDGNPLAKKYIKYKLKGKTHKAKTNSKGQLILSLKKFKKGTYKIVLYNKDGLSKANTIKIYDIATTKLTTNFYNFLQNGTKEIKVRLSTNLGGDSSSGKVIKITIDGITYYKKTDINGVACLELPYLNTGLYTAQYSFTGNKFFKSSKATNLITVLDDTTPKLTVRSTTSFGHGAGTLFKVALTAGGVPLAERFMTFDIGGETHTVLTDNQGIASIPINLNVGKYTVYYKTYNQFNINGTSGKCSITVFKRDATKLAWKCGNSYKDSSQSFSVLLTDFKGNPVSDQTVDMTIDGKTYKVKTSWNGYAKVRTSVALGSYNVRVKFKGTNQYAPCDIAHSIKVKLSRFGSGLNEKNKISSLKKYAKSSKHCQPNNAKIKSLVKKLTKGLKSKVNKAKAIFNYVKNNIWYSYYYNTGHGAVGTLKAKSGNCVDQSHLLVAMYRAAGFKARYVHGTCSFSDGRFGHVWTQVLIGKHWVCGDSINSGNSLGKILNWNTHTFKVHKKYSSLPF